MGVDGNRWIKVGIGRLRMELHKKYTWSEEACNEGIEVGVQ